MAAGPACSIVTAADEAVPVSATASCEYDTDGLGGAASAFEEGLFNDKLPLLRTAGAVSCLEDELEVFDVWAGGSLSSFTQNKDDSEAAEDIPETEAAGEEALVDTDSSETPLQPVTETVQKDPIQEQLLYEEQTSDEERQTEQEQPAVQEEAEALAEEPAEEAVVEEPEVVETQADMGAQVAAYACRFVGNPYVYGGVSLTQGTDCSGFVMSVYAQYGVSLPHSSASDRSAGYAVDGLTQALPGDIICYNGHVAIYIGNGEIVHAFNSRKGITITNADYDTIIAIRRIF